MSFKIECVLYFIKNIKNIKKKKIDVTYGSD
jgi:hypothetical protein